VLQDVDGAEFSDVKAQLAPDVHTFWLKSVQNFKIHQT
jgi:hypothetical protein